MSSLTVALTEFAMQSASHLRKKHTHVCHPHLPPRPHHITPQPHASCLKSNVYGIISLKVGVAAVVEEEDGQFLERVVGWVEVVSCQAISSWSVKGMLF